MDSSGWMGWGRGPCTDKLSGLGIEEADLGGKYVYYGCLSFYAGFEVGFGNRYVEVATAEIRGDRDCDVEVADRLGPFVGELGLFGGFFGAGVGVFLLTLFGGRGGGHFAVGV